MGNVEIKHIRTLRPSRRWIELGPAEPSWGACWSMPVQATVDFVADVFDLAARSVPEESRVERVADFLWRVSNNLKNYPEFARVDEHQVELVSVSFGQDAGSPDILVGLRVSEAGELFLASALDWDKPFAVCTKPVVGPWTELARCAHEFLVQLSRRASADQEGRLFIALYLMLEEVGLPSSCPTGMEDGRAWRLVQLNVLFQWLGQQESPRYVDLAARVLAESAGDLFLRLERKVTDCGLSVGAFAAARYLALQSGQIRRTKDGRILAVSGVFESASTLTGGSPQVDSKLLHVAPPRMYRSQRLAYERCVALGRLHFSGRAREALIQPRTYPLLMGATGVGKTYLVRAIADALSAHLVFLSFGRFMPAGARDARQTLFVILDALVAHQRVVVFLDELDKALTWSDSWSRSVTNDLWAALDLIFPLAAYHADVERHGKDKRIEPKDFQRLWFIGAGTWQNLTGQRTGIGGTGVIGFGERYGARKPESVVEQIRASQDVPPELTARFHSQPVLLTYPQQDEVPQLLMDFGVFELARKAGVNLNGVELDFSKGGVRVIEALVADLLLAIQRQQESEEHSHA